MSMSNSGFMVQTAYLVLFYGCVCVRTRVHACALVLCVAL